MTLPPSPPVARPTGVTVIPPALSARPSSADGVRVVRSPASLTRSGGLWAPATPTTASAATAVTAPARSFLVLLIHTSGLGFASINTWSRGE